MENCAKDPLEKDRRKAQAPLITGILITYTIMKLDNKKDNEESWTVKKIMAITERLLNLFLTVLFNYFIYYVF